MTTQATFRMIYRERLAPVFLVRPDFKIYKLGAKS